MADDSLVAVSGQGIADTALEVMTLMSGKPYKPGGKTIDGFDCSGFVTYVLEKVVPNAGSSFAMNAMSFKTSSLFDTVSSKLPGDIIVFDPPPTSSTGHVGIVYDQILWIGSQSSTGVAKVQYSAFYWSTRPHIFRRLKIISTQSVSLGIRAMRRTT